MASGCIYDPVTRDPLPRGTVAPKRARTWLVRDVNGERHEIKADEMQAAPETLTFWLEGQVIGCFKGWSWYRLHGADLPKLDPVKSSA